MMWLVALYVYYCGSGGYGGRSKVGVSGGGCDSAQRSIIIIQIGSAENSSGGWGYSWRCGSYGSRDVVGGSKDVIDFIQLLFR